MKKTELTLQVPTPEIIKHQWGYFLGNILFIPLIIFLSYSIFSNENDFYTKLGYLAFIIVLSYHFTQARQATIAIVSEKLVLNEEGIQYFSGRPTQKENWQMTWDKVKLIEIKLHHINAIDIMLCIHTAEKPYEMSIFKWVDTPTLIPEHITLQKQILEKVRFKLTHSPYTKAEFNEILNHTPLYQYFETNNIPVQLPDSKIFTELSPVVKWGAVLIVIFILLLILPFFITYLFL